MVKGVKRAKQKHTIMLQLDIELYQQLKMKADQLHIPVSTLIRLWIVEKLEMGAH